MKIKPDIGSRLADRITSPDYKRTTGRLAGLDGERCPLGVLCDMYLEEHEEACWSPMYDRFFDAEGFTNAHLQHPPKGVREWAGLEMGGSYRIAFLNDNGADINDIARMLRGEKVRFSLEDSLE